MGSPPAECDRPRISASSPPPHSSILYQCALQRNSKPNSAGALRLDCLLITHSEMVAAADVGGTEIPMLSNALFIIVGFFYTTQVLHPIPMTYLSEIAFPLDFCIKLGSSASLFLLHSFHWVRDKVWGAAWHQRDRAHVSSENVFIGAAAWGLSTLLLWMEHRRGRSPSVVLRFFWMVTWIQVTSDLFGHERVNHLYLGTSSTLVTSMAAVSYCCYAILGASCFFTPTPITSDLVDLPMVTTPSAYLHSANFKFPFSGYGTFSNMDAHPPSTIMPKSENDPTICSGVSVSRVSSHSISRGGVITATIPACTTSIWAQHRFVSYKIVVQTEDDRWTVRRQYSDFATLYEELPAAMKESCTLPADDIDRPHLSWKSRPQPMKAKLEKFIQRVLASKDFAPHSSQALCDFLDMEYVDEAFFSSSVSGLQTGGLWSSHEHQVHSQLI